MAFRWRLGMLLGIATLRRATVPRGQGGNVMEQQETADAMTYGTNRPGDAYRHSHAESPEHCAFLCSLDGGCRSWVYKHEHSEGRTPGCTFNNDAPPPLQDERCVSGVAPLRHDNEEDGPPPDISTTTTTTTATTTAMMPSSSSSSSRRWSSGVYGGGYGGGDEGGVGGGDGGVGEGVTSGDSSRRRGDKQSDQHKGGRAPIMLASSAPMALDGRRSFLPIVVEDYDVYAPITATAWVLLWRDPSAAASTEGASRETAILSFWHATHAHTHAHNDTRAHNTHSHGPHTHTHTPPPITPTIMAHTTPFAKDGVGREGPSEYADKLFFGGAAVPQKQVTGFFSRDSFPHNIWAHVALVIEPSSPHTDNSSLLGKPQVKVTGYIHGKLQGRIWLDLAALTHVEDTPHTDIHAHTHTTHTGVFVWGGAKGRAAMMTGMLQHAHLHIGTAFTEVEVQHSMSAQPPWPIPPHVAHVVFGHAHTQIHTHAHTHTDADAHTGEADASPARVPGGGVGGGGTCSAGDGGAAAAAAAAGNSGHATVPWTTRALELLTYPHSGGCGGDGGGCGGSGGGGGDTGDSNAGVQPGDQQPHAHTHTHMHTHTPLVHDASGAYRTAQWLLYGSVMMAGGRRVGGDREYTLSAWKQGHDDSPLAVPEALASAWSALGLQTEEALALELTDSEWFVYSSGMLAQLILAHTAMHDNVPLESWPHAQPADLRAYGEAALAKTWTDPFTPIAITNHTANGRGTDAHTGAHTHTCADVCACNTAAAYLHSVAAWAMDRHGQDIEGAGLYLHSGDEPDTHTHIHDPSLYEDYTHVYPDNQDGQGLWDRVWTPLRHRLYGDSTHTDTHAPTDTTGAAAAAAADGGGGGGGGGGDGGVYTHTRAHAHHGHDAHVQDYEDQAELDLMLDAAHAGDPDAMVWMGKAYYWGFGRIVQPDVQRALQWMLKAAELGQPEGQYNAGVMLMRGDATDTHAHTAHTHTHAKSEVEGGREYVRAAAEQGFAPALAAEGMWELDDAPVGAARDHPKVVKAESLLLRAAEQGNTDAHYSLAGILLPSPSSNNTRPSARTKSVWPEDDIWQAAHHLAQAASGGHMGALYSLAHGLWDPEVAFRLASEVSINQIDAYQLTPNAAAAAGNAGGSIGGVGGSGGTSHKRLNATSEASLNATISATISATSATISATLEATISATTATPQGGRMVVVKLPASSGAMNAEVELKSLGRSCHRAVQLVSPVAHMVLGGLIGAAYDTGSLRMFNAAAEAGVLSAMVESWLGESSPVRRRRQLQLAREAWPVALRELGEQAMDNYLSGAAAAVPAEATCTRDGGSDTHAYPPLVLEAAAWLHKAVVQGDTRALYDLGWLYETLGDHDNALHTYTHAITHALYTRNDIAIAAPAVLSYLWLRCRMWHTHVYTCVRSVCVGVYACVCGLYNCVGRLGLWVGGLRGRVCDAFRRVPVCVAEHVVLGVCVLLFMLVMYIRYTYTRRCRPTTTPHATAADTRSDGPSVHAHAHIDDQSTETPCHKSTGESTYNDDVYTYHEGAVNNGGGGWGLGVDEADVGIRGSESPTAHVSLPQRCVSGGVGGGGCGDGVSVCGCG